jgi:hypothetical protein
MVTALAVGLDGTPGGLLWIEKTVDTITIWSGEISARICRR